jgi:hypothetical protein
MSTLEIRRHSLRKEGGGSQLSQQGVEYARRLGTTMGPFARAVTSIVPRARETAIAMGFAVDYEIMTLCADPAAYAEAETTRWWEAEHPFVALAELVGRGGPFGLYAHSLAAQWRDILTPLPNDGSALFIGHSGELEAALIACFTRANYTAWGECFAACEGARLNFAGEPANFSDVELLRLDSFSSR